MLAGYYKRKVDPWEAAAWSALAVDTLAGTWGTVGSKKGHQGNTLAQAAAAIARAVASHKSVQACHSPWGIVAARETADGETVEVPWQKGPEREARPQRGPERELDINSTVSNGLETNKTTNDQCALYERYTSI